ncbi:hypothetical protein K8R78_05680 [bacterium]|nr:hypothetical protein [bacterium]
MAHLQSTDKPRRRLLVLLIIGLVLSLTVGWMMMEGSAELTDLSGYGILEFQFAFDRGEIATILDSWTEPEASALVHDQFYLDMFFPLGYGLLLGSVGLFLLRRREGYPRWLEGSIVLMAVAAPVIDLLENIMSLMLIDGYGSVAGATATVFMISVAVKWSLVALLVLVSVVLGVRLLFGRRA